MIPLRSVLYAPAANTRALEKAAGLPCDAVILDLEDSVAPERKPEARAAAAAAIRGGGFGRRLVAVRVNGLETEWGPDDLRAVLAAGPDVVVAPKIATAADLDGYRAALSGAPASLHLWAMVETAGAVLNLGAIAEGGRPSRLSGLVMGLNDLATDLRARSDPARSAFAYALSATVTAARAYGLIALDGVSNDISDPAALEAECRQARDLGFDGKTLIHPDQIAVANRAFSPTEAEVDWAEAVAAAFHEAPGAGVLRVRGVMVERLHLREAERVLGLATPVGA